VDKVKFPFCQALERGRRAVGRGSRMADVVPDEQVLSTHEAEAVEIRQGPAGDGSKPDRMRWMEASEAKVGRWIGPGDSTNVSVR
jgi:hypothetical protein